VKLWIYIVRRLILIVPVLIGVATITFAITSALPTEARLASQFGYHPLPGGGNPYSPTISCESIGINQPGNCTNPTYQRDVNQLGLNKPIPVQWAIYVGNALTFNWGQTSPNSWATKEVPLPQTSTPVTEVLGWYLPYTLELAALSLIIILIIAIPLGNYSAVYRNRPIDQTTRIVSFSGYALPTFILGTLLLLAGTAILGGNIAICGGKSIPFLQVYGSWPGSVQPSGWACAPGLVNTPPSYINGQYYYTTPTGFPTLDSLIYGGATGLYLAGDSVARLILPAITIAYGTVAVILRYVRNSMLEVMNLDFVRTARSKGVSESDVIRRHAGRNSLNVTVTVIGLTFAFFIAGFPVIESVFHLYGVGLIFAYSVNYVGGLDFGLIFGTTLLFTFVVVIANLVVDVLYAYLDPRVRLG
jgi:peptide/nickel transport system permease protein